MTDYGDPFAPKKMPADPFARIKLAPKLMTDDELQESFDKAMKGRGWPFEPGEKPK